MRQCKSKLANDDDKKRAQKEKERKKTIAEIIGYSIIEYSIDATVNIEMRNKCVRNDVLVFEVKCSMKYTFLSSSSSSSFASSVDVALQCERFCVYAIFVLCHPHTMCVCFFSFFRLDNFPQSIRIESFKIA